MYIIYSVLFDISLRIQEYFHKKTDFNANIHI
jgi:hypothetical protein